MGITKKLAIEKMMEEEAQTERERPEDFEGFYEAQERRFQVKKEDPVNHPPHYTTGKIEVIDTIEDWQLNYHRGNAVKYIARAGKKDAAKELEDLKKAQWYLTREIAKMEKK